MTLLFFLEFGKKGLGLFWVVYLLVSTVLLYTAYQKWKEPFLYQDLPDGTRIQVPNKPRQSILKVARFKMWLGLTGIALILFILIQSGVAD